MILTKRWIPIIDGIHAHQYDTLRSTEMRRFPVKGHRPPSSRLDSGCKRCLLLDISATHGGAIQNMNLNVLNFDESVVDVCARSAAKVSTGEHDTGAQRVA